jgi:hypothetical protein
LDRSREAGPKTGTSVRRKIRADPVKLFKHNDLSIITNLVVGQL